MHLSGKAELAAILDKRQKLTARMDKLQTETHALETQRAKLAEARDEMEAQMQQLARHAAQIQNNQRKLDEVAQKLIAREQGYQKRKQLLSQEEIALGQHLLEVDAYLRGLGHEPPAQPAPLRKSCNEIQSQSCRDNQRVIVAVHVDLNSAHNFFTGITENLSVGGLFVSTFDLHPVETAIDLVIHLPDQTPIRTQGQVCWIRDQTTDDELTPGMGVRFLTLTETEQTIIDGFLQVRAPLLFEAQQKDAAQTQMPG